MTELIRRFRGVGIGLVALVLTAGIAFAGTSAGNHAPATDLSAPKASEAPEVPDASGAPADRHGALVSAAAHRSTPAGFRNHGAFVSCVAHMKDATLATIDWSKVTPAACAAQRGPEPSD